MNTSFGKCRERLIRISAFLSLGCNVVGLSRWVQARVRDDVLVRGELAKGYGASARDDAWSDRSCLDDGDSWLFDMACSKALFSIGWAELMNPIDILSP